MNMYVVVGHGYYYIDWYYNNCYSGLHAEDNSRRGKNNSLRFEEGENT